jgi:hypothetical protein
MVSFTFDEVPKNTATVVGPILAEYNIAEPARATWLPPPDISPASGRPVPIHPVADVHPSRMDRAAGKATGLLPRHR